MKTQSSLPDCTSAPAFRAGARFFSLRDIFDAAPARGALEDFRAAWESRRAAAARADAAGLEPDGPEVEAASNVFRYSRDLVTAEECERWLTQRGLTFDDLTTSISRRLQAELGRFEAPAKDRLATETGEEGCSGAGDRDGFYRDVLLADEFAKWARDLAWRVALAMEEGARIFPSVSEDTDSRSSGNHAVAPEGGALSEGQRIDWAGLEARFAAAAARLTEPERRRRELAALRLALTRLRVVASEFDSVTAAREAFLCAREDGVSLEEIARTNGFQFEEYAWLFEDFAPDWQQALLSASPGEVTPPMPHAAGFVVLQLLDKRDPSLEDAEVRKRLDKNLARRWFGELEARHIRWLLNIEVET